MISPIQLVVDFALVLRRGPKVRGTKRLGSLL